MSINSLLSGKEFLDEVGWIYPIRLKDYDQFQEVSNLLIYSMDFFKLDNPDIDKHFNLFGCLIYAKYKEVNGIPRIDSKFISDMSLLIKLTTQKDVFFNYNSYSFDIVDTKYSINQNNYDAYREIVMNQNLIFEPKIYKNKYTQRIAAKVIKSRQVGQPNIQMEDKISTVVALTGVGFDQIKDYTIAQLEDQFNRVIKINNYQTSMLFKTVSTDVPNPDFFACHIDLHTNPYDTILTHDRSGINKLNKALSK